MKTVATVEVLSKHLCTDGISLCLFNFGLRSRIKIISKIKQSNLFDDTSSGS